VSPKPCSNGDSIGLPPGRDGDAVGMPTGLADRAVDHVRVAAYEVPTATESESDGTLSWDSTSIVIVELRSGDCTGLGYTYCHPAAASVIEDKLAGIVKGCDALAPQQAWAEMDVELRQLGHAGIARMAMSAVDIALWDLKSRLLGVCLADLLPRCRQSTPIYGSGGFCNYSDDELRRQMSHWVQLGCSSVKMKVGREKDRDAGRVRAAREEIGDGIELMVDGNGAYAPTEAVSWGERFAADFGVTYFEEPVSSQDVDGMRFVRERAPGGLAIAAGEYAWGLSDLHRLLAAGAVDILQADVTRCGGITNMLRADGLCRARSMPFSAHCCPAVTAHVGCAVETLVHMEYFFDHVRIEGMLFDGALEPHGGTLTPDRSRPGLGLELRRADARRFQVYGEE
jgi:L-alanine-DL-glutamate epimerase-like enolase superfamily enzyme